MLREETSPAPSVAEEELDEVRSSLRQLLQQAARPAMPAEPRPAAGGPGSLVGEVADTHHPELPGRVLVRWFSDSGQACEQWLQCLRGALPARGDRVLLEQPANWPERLVTGVLAGTAREPAAAAASAAASLKLAPEHCLRITDEADRALVEVHASSQGPVVRLLSDTLTLEAPRTLRLQAETIELQAGRGGVDIRTESDTVVRSRFIRLN
ncbi:hypothetical protein [Eleftheria terrae]|uniref:hypothetical protein n=1 Tax=Eleftheria terrae TaxID=1597781 RepID=UPI00263B7FD8|nr:hypothetical protein [Eleftheria terrae]WKB53293.1 hypothetical protein N7L95_02535 [Eleftheria terrae]